MSRLGPLISVEDFGWWAIAIALALSIAGVGLALYASRLCARLLRLHGVDTGTTTPPPSS